MNAFVTEMEARFGSDEALGVYFVTDDDVTLTLAEFEALAAQYDDKADMPGMQSFLPDGGSAVCCTDYACLIYKALPGRVEIFGFANEDNPSSRCAREEFHPGGHDFAVVDGRYIVDPWPRLVPAVLEQMVFDLEDAEGAALALEVYGPRACWTRMNGAENYAKKAMAMAA